MEVWIWKRLGSESGKYLIGQSSDPNQHHGQLLRKANSSGNKEYYIYLKCFSCYSNSTYSLTPFYVVNKVLSLFWITVPSLKASQTKEFVVFSENYQCCFFSAFSWALKTQHTAKLWPHRGIFQTASGGWNAGYHPHPPSSSPPAPVSVPVLFLILFACPFPASAPSPAPNPAPPHPWKIHCHPPIPDSCLSRPAAPCRVKWTVPVSEERHAPRSAQPGSAQLSVLNLLCDYCQSETPPPRRSVMMGTIWHRAQPAMQAGIREQRRYRNPGWGKDTEAEAKYC